MSDFWTFVNELDPIWYWGFGLAILFPIIIIVLGELNYVAEKRNERLVRPLRSFKNVILPLIACTIVLIKVLDFQRSSIAIKVLETIIWVMVINSGLSLFSGYYLSAENKGPFGKTVPQLFIDIFRVVMVLFGGALILSIIWDVELGGLVTALGLGSFVIGLALQDTLGNLFSGIALVYEKPFNVGDNIKVDDKAGTVIEMNWRAVHLQTRKKELLVMPHMMIAQAAILNYSKPTKIVRLERLMGFSYDDAPNKVKEALIQTCLNTPGILHDPYPEVKTVEYADSAIVYEIEFAISDYAFREEISDELMTRIWYTAKRNNFTIPFPQRTLHYYESTPTPAQENAQSLSEGMEKLPKFLPIKKERTERLLESSNIVHFGQGETIFAQGDEVGDIYVLLNGEVELTSSEEGQEEIVVNTLQEGDFFGEVALLSGRKSSMTARATTDVELIKIIQDDVIDMVSDNPSLAFKLGEVMENRKKKLAKKMELEAKA